MTTLNELTDEMKKHQGELILNGFSVVKLLDIREDDDDFYGVFFVPGEGIIYSSCVRDWVPLKGSITEDTYNELVRVWDLNAKYWIAGQFDKDGNNFRVKYDLGIKNNGIKKDGIKDLK